MICGKKLIHREFMLGSWDCFENGEPIHPKRFQELLGPNSVDVTLSRHILIPDETVFPVVPPEDCLQIIDPMSENHHEDMSDEEACKAARMKRHEIGESFVLLPRQTILGCTEQRFDCIEPVFYESNDPRYFVPMYDGRSTMGRLFLLSHVSAGFGDYGFMGAFTLEIVNLNRCAVVLRAGMRIGQVYFQQVLGPSTKDIYKGAYSNVDHFDKPMPPSLGKHRF